MLYQNRIYLPRVPCNAYFVYVISCQDLSVFGLNIGKYGRETFSSWTSFNRVLILQFHFAAPFGKFQIRRKG